MLVLGYILTSQSLIMKICAICYLEFSFVTMLGASHERQQWHSAYRSTTLVQIEKSEFLTWHLVQLFMLLKGWTQHNVVIPFSSRASMRLTFDWFWVKCLKYYWMNCHEIWNMYVLLRINCYNFGDPFTFCPAASSGETMYLLVQSSCQCWFKTICYEMAQIQTIIMWLPLSESVKFIGF